MMLHSHHFCCNRYHRGKSGVERIGVLEQTRCPTGEDGRDDVVDPNHKPSAGFAFRAEQGGSRSLDGGKQENGRRFAPTAAQQQHGDCGVHHLAVPDPSFA